MCVVSESIRPGSLLHRYPSSTLSYLASKVKRPTVYLGAGTLLILIGMVFVIVAAALSGPFITILDEAVVVSALTDCTVIGHYQWTRRQFPHSDVHPHQLAFFRSNGQLNHLFDSFILLSTLPSVFLPIHALACKFCRRDFAAFIRRSMVSFGF